MMITQTSASFDTIREDLETFITSLPAKYVWKDLLVSSVGGTLLDLLAGFGSFIAYRVMMTRREVSLSSALLRSSVQAIAETFGYSVFRGKMPHVSITITPSSTTTINKFGVVGSYGDYDVVALEQQNLSVGASKTFEVIIGNANISRQVVQTTDPALFRFTDQNISEDYFLTLNDVEVLSSDEFKDLLLVDGVAYYLIITNYLSSVDVSYLQEGTEQYGVGDDLEIHYVEWADIGTIDPAGVGCDYGVVTASSLVSAATDPDELDQIRIKAPAYHEVQNIVKGREDYRKLVITLVEGAVDANGRDVTPAVIELVYLKSDQGTLTAQQKSDLITALDDYRPFGVQPPTIIDPTHVDVAISVAVTALDASLTVAEVEAIIEGSIDDYQMKLGNTIDLDDFEYQLEQNAKVKIARVTLASGKLSMSWNEYALITYSLTMS